MTDELSSLDIRGGKKEGEIVVNRSIIDELHSLDGIKWQVKVVLFEVSLMNFIF